MKLVSEKSVTLLEVNDLLRKRHKESTGEFPYEQQNTLDYSEKFVDRITPAKAKELRKELSDLKFLSEEQIVTLINILPKKDEVTKACLTGEKLDVTEDQVKEVTKIIKPYAKDAKDPVATKEPKAEKEPKADKEAKE
jgi:DNA-directed RNA polymerase subunit F